MVNNWPGQAVDAHGARHGNALSTRAYEVYGNTIENKVYDDGTTPIPDRPDCFNLTWTAMTLRGGEGLVFDNKIKGVRYGIVIITEDTLYDVNADVYPEPYQIGYKSGLQLGPTHSGVNLPQGDGDLFSWNNTFTSYSNCSSTYHRAFHNGGSAALLRENRDFHLETPKPGYQPYAYPHPLRRLVAPFSLDVSPPGRSVHSGGTATYAIQIQHVAGFTSPVTLQIGASPSSNLVVDLTAPSAVFDSPGGQATLRLTDLHDASFSASLGYRIPITATGGDFTQTASAVFLINPKSTYLPLVIR